MKLEEIKKWFNGQHCQPVMLQKGWKKTLLREKVYTEDIVIELLLEFSERQTSTEQSDNHDSKALHIADVNCSSSVKHRLEYSIWSSKVSWCPLCKEHFYNSRNEKHTTKATSEHYHILNCP